MKVVCIEKGLLDNQNPCFCMGWPGLYLMDSIEHSRSVCVPTPCKGESKGASSGRVHCEKVLLVFLVITSVLLKVFTLQDLSK